MALVDLSPLLTGTSGNGISVAGILVGGAAEGLARPLITGAEESPPSGGSLVYRDGSVFRKGVDGTVVEIPLATRIDGVLANGGTLRIGQVALTIENGRVARVYVRGGALDALSLRSEKDIERQWGVPSGIEKSFGNRLYHYVDRQLVVGWGTRDGRVEFVALGADPWREPRLGAQELLTELMWSFGDLARADWAEPASGAQRTRYRRVAALAQALDLGTPRSVAKGDFLQGNLTPGRELVLVEIARTISPESGKAQFPSKTYQRLMRHRVMAEGVIGFNRSVLENSIPVLAGVMVAQERVAASLRSSLTVIDGWLCRLMDPDRRTFAESELIARFGWPDVDVRHQEAAEAWGE